MRRVFLVTILGALILGGVLRSWRLGSVPPALYCDEAFHGYEAYCLLRTGADSRGIRMPFLFSIFGVGWEEPLYIYLTTVPVALAGTVAGAARGVAAAAGTLAIPAVAFLAWGAGGPRAAAAAAALVALSPWSFHFSRIGFQASLLPLVLAAGAAALLRGAGQGGAARPAGALPAPGTGAGDTAARSPHAGWLAGGAALLALSLYTYVAARLLLPLLLIGFAGCFLGDLRRAGLRKLAPAVAALILLAAPIAWIAATPSGLARYEDVGLQARYPGGEAAWRFLGNYASYFSPSFLLVEGDPNLRHSVRGFGALHAHDLLFLVAGIAGAFLRRRPVDLFMLWWIAVGPVPASLAADPAHAVRAIGVLPAVYALAGCGVAGIFREGGPLALTRVRGRAVLAAILAAAGVSCASYLHEYFVDYPVYSAPAWQYGLKEAYQEVEVLAADHDSVYVTRAEDFPFIHRLYYFAFPPEEYQRHRFARTKYLFDEPVFYRGGLVPGRANPLFMLKPHELPDTGIRVRKAIPYPDGSPAFVLAW